jgi:hypothetical protein
LVDVKTKFECKRKLDAAHLKVFQFRGTVTTLARRTLSPSSSETPDDPQGRFTEFVKDPILSQKRLTRANELTA